MIDIFTPGLAAFVVLVLLIPIVVRLPFRIPSILSVFYAAIIIEVLMLVFGIFVSSDFHPWHATSAYGLLFMLLWFVYGAVAKSISLLIAVTLFKAPSKTLSIQDAAKIPHREFDNRVKLLCHMGHVILDATGNYQITPQGQKLVYKLLKARKFFNIRSNGLYE